MVKVGIIGCGNVLSAYAATLDKLRLENVAEVVVVCGRENQRDAANRFPHARFTNDDAEVTAAGNVDLVLILTAMPTHARLVRAALEGGKHVLVEKPLATNLAEAAALIDLANNSAGYLLAAPFTVLSPTFQTMARHIRDGDIGRPCLARARYGWAGPWWSQWFYEPGGGCLFDLGIYCVASLTGLLGPVQRVVAMTGVAVPERTINGRQIQVKAEDNAQVLLDFGNATFGVVTSGFTMQQYKTPALEVYGTTGTIQMLGDDWDPDGYELWQNDLGAWQLYKETTPDWSWTDGLNHIVACIATGQRPRLTPEYAYHVLEVLIRAQEAGKTGRAMEVETRFAPLPLIDSATAAPAHLVHDRSRETHH